MRIPLTKYGLPQVIVYPAIVFTAMLVFPLEISAFVSYWAIITIEAVLAVVLFWALMFFRDPERRCPEDSNILLSPADGRITEIETIEETSFIGGPAIRIGIFLSIFNTHINRAPCNVQIEKVTYKKGKYLNAMNPESGRLNESNELYMARTDNPEDKLIVKQISGAIARRIVCAAVEGQKLTGGDKFGMIKFGSRTELYVPVREDARCLVKIGDKVKAGLTPLVKYEIRDMNDDEIKD